ncbi:hypothetical protein QBC44DRAFT_389586 [Cladorrhinum sp. PSN332]|nr:hypothetical protein QBC44DRAFT_389586 [Cladorrhinum sp. PSN332]
MSPTEANNASQQISIASIPTEIIHQICALSDKEDLKSLRSTCQKLGAVADYHLLRGFSLWFHPDCFQVLQEIANHPYRSRCVRSLSYITNSPTSIIPSNPEPDSLLMKQCGYDAEELPEYKRVVMAQNNTVESNADFALLTDIIPKLVNLEEMIVSHLGDHTPKCRYLQLPHWHRQLRYRRYPDGDEGEQMQQPDNPFVDLVGDGFRYPRQDDRHMRSVVEGLHAAGTSIKLKEIHAGYLRTSYFRSSHPVWAATGSIAILSSDQLANLTVFDIAVNTAKRTSRADSGQGLAQGCHLRDVLARMPNLETLCLDFIHWEPKESRSSRIPIWPWPAQLEDIIPDNQYWPRLRQLNLGPLETDGQPLLNFLVRHKHSLKNLKMTHPRLFNTSWKSFLPKLKASFQADPLDARFFNTLWGQSPDTPTTTQSEPSEQFRLTDIDEYCIRDNGHGTTMRTDLVREYMLSPPGTRCALLDVPNSFEVADNSEDSDDGDD